MENGLITSILNCRAHALRRHLIPVGYPTVGRSDPTWALILCGATSALPRGVTKYSRSTLSSVDLRGSSSPRP